MDLTIPYHSQNEKYFNPQTNIISVDQLYENINQWEVKQICCLIEILDKITSDCEQQTNDVAGFVGNDGNKDIKESKNYSYGGFFTN